MKITVIASGNSYLISPRRVAGRRERRIAVAQTVACVCPSRRAAELPLTLVKTVHVSERMSVRARRENEKRRTEPRVLVGKGIRITDVKIEYSRNRFFNRFTRNSLN